jgi:hypothetical protein
MKKLMLAALVAVPFVAFTQQKAKAGNECLDLPRWLRYRLCTCLHEKCGSGSGHWGVGAGCVNGHCGAGGCGYGGCGYGGSGYGGCMNGACSRGGGCCGCCGLFGCDSRVPGPWYLYWPYNGRTLEIEGYGPAWPGGWNYEMHFQTASPWGMPAIPAAFGATVAFPGTGPAGPPPQAFPGPAPAVSGPNMIGN